MTYFVYILKCADETFYTGVTTNLERRLLEHNSTVKGAKYTRARRPVGLVYSEELKDRSEAQQEESRIKKLKKSEKNDLIKSFNITSKKIGFS